MRKTKTTPTNLTFATNTPHPAPGGQSRQEATMNQTFEMNGKAYKTDIATLNVLRSIVPAAKTSGDMSAVMAVMDLGLTTGRINETK